MTKKQETLQMMDVLTEEQIEAVYQFIKLLEAGSIKNKEKKKRSEKGFMKITMADNFDDMPDGMEEYLENKKLFN